VKYLASILLFLLALPVLAQHQDEQLAAQYYQNEEFDKAAELYKKLHRKNTESIYIYRNYLNSLIQIKGWDEAKKMLKKQKKRHPVQYIYSVDLAYVYRLNAETKSEQKILAEIQRKIPRSVSAHNDLAHALINRDYSDAAINTYIKGRRSLNDQELFSEELIDIYYDQEAYRSVVDECLNLLRWSPNNLPTAKQKLIYLVDQDKEIQYLQERTLLLLQKHPGLMAFDELLMWVYLQQKKWNAAYRQAVAMDKRQKDVGIRLLNLASIASNADRYDIATKCYNYVIAQGDMNPFFMKAKVGLLDAGYQGFQKNNSAGIVLSALIKNYENFLNEFGKNGVTNSAMKQLADLYIFHEHDLHKGMAILNEIIAIPASQHFIAKCKLDLADAYLINNELWEATLLYGQVDKDFKEEPLGQEAKLRNAKLSFFKGEFEWAGDQLDILKTATSQLISNDAIELALLIQDNSGLDSNTDALNDYARANLYLFQNKFNESLEILNMMPFKYPKHSLKDEIYYTKARVYKKMKNFVEAEKNFKYVVDLFAYDILADNALFELAQMYEYQLNDKEKAVKAYEKIILDYNSSLYVVEARKKYKQLKSYLKKSSDL
jgi:tetratricopeptide (TPR) repeat protein